VAQTAAQPDPGALQPMSPQREQALRALRAWYVDWAQTARAVIHRRDYLVMMGLSKRRRPGGADSESVDDSEDALVDEVERLDTDDEASEVSSGVAGQARGAATPGAGVDAQGAGALG
jgi:hypothetical protein